MADKVVTNQASIDAARAANAAATQKKAALESKAAAALEKGKPILSQALSGTAKLAQAVNAQIAAMANPGGTYDPVSGIAKTPAQLKAEADTAKAAATGINKYGGLTPEQIELSKLYGKERTDALAEAAGVQFVDVPGAVYDYSNTGKNSAYDLLLSQFSLYGLSALIEPLKNLITNDTSEGELTLMLRQTEPYKKRFAANADRLAKGLTPLSEKEYLGMEDQYQNIMRNYGLPASYYAKGDLGRQEGFEKLLANDVSATELEDRVMTAQSRVINANPEIKQALRSFYPDITDGDILAYTLDPTKALTDIKRKVTAAEIGGAAIGAGLKTSQTAAEGLAAYGVTKGQAQQGYGAIAEFLPTGEKLSQIYKESPYTQTQAEQEIFNLANSAEAAKKRKRLSQLETASFGGSSGAGAGALSRDRAGNYQQYGAPGAGAF
jgi:hypothetical protein